MAPARGAQAEGAGQADGVPRDHRAGDRGGDRQLARARHEAGRGAGGPADPRPARRLRGVERRVPPDRPRHVGRPGAERRGPPRRRARAGPDGVPQPPRTGTSRARSSRDDTDVPRDARRARRQATRRRAATSTPTTGALAAGADVALLDEAGRRRRSRLDSTTQPFTRRVGRDADRSPSDPKAAVHHVDAAAGGGPQARLQRGAHDAVAQGLYERGLITYMRTDSTNLSEQAIERGPRRRSARMYGDEYLPTEPRDVPQQGEERAGGARGDPPRGRSHPHRRRRQRRAPTPTSAASTS